MKKILLVVFMGFQFSYNFAVTELTEAIKRYEKSDAALNKEYNALQSSLDKKDKERLRQSQLAWIKYRDQYCHFRFKAYADSSLRKYNCLRGLTDAKRDELGFDSTCIASCCD